MGKAGHAAQPACLASRGRRSWILIMTTQADPRFPTRELVTITAADAGVSRERWKSIDASNPSQDVALDEMTRGRFDVLPIVTDSTVDAYWQTEKWNDFSSISRKPITDADLAPHDTHIRDLIRLLAESSRLFYFLSHDREVVGLVSVVNLNRRPVKVWLFSLLSEIETRLAQLISRHINDDTLYGITLGRTTERKYAQVKLRLWEDQDSGLDLPLVEYLYFSDLVDAALDKKLYTVLGYSRKDFDRSFGSMVNMRDQVAHPVRSVIRDAHAIGKLWRRIQRIEEALNRLREA